MNSYKEIAEEASAVLKKAKVLHSKTAVDVALQSMASKINGDYQGRTPVILCVMNGGLFATAKLCEYLNIPLEMDYVHATRYQKEMVGKTLQWISEPRTSLANRDVLIVDDILDEGITLKELISYCHTRGAASVKTALLVKKLHQRCIDESLGDYIGIQVPDDYVFGCGMDYKGFLRNLPEIYALGE